MSIEFLIYFVVFLFSIIVLWLYLRRIKGNDLIAEEKIDKAKVEGVHEPISLHPVINPDICIGSGACIKACPEEDILGLKNGRAVLINASHCVGHGACFHACPVEAISLRIGTEKRGVDLPHINQNYETNVEGIFIAGELGGMGLIKNSVEQGKQAVDSIAKKITKSHTSQYDLIIIGAGPAGISASLQAKKSGLKAIILEQDTLGGTVFSFPRAKVVMTAPMDIPLHGKIKLFRTSKKELLDLWLSLIEKHQIEVKENSKVENIYKQKNEFLIKTLRNEELTSQSVLLAIGRRGTPRKLGVKGEELEKVAYRLLEPEFITNKNIIVVGGGDSAIESALLLADDNKVILSYRSDKFSRLKPKNAENIQKANDENKIKVILNSNLLEITSSKVDIKLNNSDEILKFDNDLVYIFAGGELPTQFLQNSGIEITKRFGYTVKSHT
ncbi:MAG: NAD(P)-binding domain-containing protein [Saprospiraceae bacterium]|nr:NAD(P)-binding domain-containing protein [Saprospiraceae bacterium]